METTIANSFETTDLWLAAFLKTSRVSFNGSRRLNGIVYFMFSDPDVCQRLIDEYFQGALVQANELKTSINFFRDVIFSKNANT